MEDTHKRTDWRWIDYIPKSTYDQYQAYLLTQITNMLGMVGQAIDTVLLEVIHDVLKEHIDKKHYRIRRNWETD